MNRYALSMVCLFMMFAAICAMAGDCRRPSKRQRETNTSVLHHHCCWSRLQVRASTVQSLVAMTTCTTNAIVNKSSQSSPNECRYTAVPTHYRQCEW